MPAPLLEVRDLARSFYGVHALAGVHLRVQPHRITGLIGPNGAGKTTLFNCISGIVAPEGGRVVFADQDITGWRPDRIANAGLTRTFQIARGFPRLSVYENLLLYGTRQPGESVWHALARAREARRRECELTEAAYVIAERLNLVRVLNDPAASLSGGQKKLLEIGRVLMASPRLILLDEPVAGVDAKVDALEDFVGGRVARDQASHAEQPACGGGIRPLARPGGAHCRRPMYASCTAGSDATSAKLPSARFRPSASTTTW